VSDQGAILAGIFGIGGVVIGSVLTIAKDSLSDHFKKKQSANYAAIHIVCVLDEFFDSCVDVVGDDGTEGGQSAGGTEYGESYLLPQVKPPSPPRYPHDIDWKSVKAGLMYRILALPNEVEEIRQYLADYRKHDWPPSRDYFDERQKAYARLALNVLKIASEIRKTYGIPARPVHDWQEDWSAETWLGQRLSEIEDRGKGARSRVEKGAADGSAQQEN